MQQIIIFNQLTSPRNCGVNHFISSVSKLVYDYFRIWKQLNRSSLVWNYDKSKIYLIVLIGRKVIIPEQNYLLTIEPFLYKKVDFIYHSAIEDYGPFYRRENFSQKVGSFNIMSMMQVLIK